ncbi:MAG: STAS domain-containing protein [Planctomycetaceae bacterium]|nr:STAS domain-containing protein [Planctomycetaceae bacterium]MCA9111157.1 STAS domain-containing protein [Planctomycetaceae bacterium]
MTDFTNYEPSYFDLEVDNEIAVASFHKNQLTEEDNLEQLGNELFSLVDQYQFRKIVLNLAPVQYVTSSVLGKLITLHRKLGRNEGQLILCDIHDDLKNVLTTSKLMTYFTTAKDVPAAKAAFK